jgi:hypothetical protein
MNTLLAISINSTTPVILGTFAAIAVAVTFLAWRRRLSPLLALRTVSRLRARSTLIASGWLLSVVIFATFLAGCKGGH